MSETPPQPTPADTGRFTPGENRRDFLRLAVGGVVIGVIGLGSGNLLSRIMAKDHDLLEVLDTSEPPEEPETLSPEEATRIEVRDSVWALAALINGHPGGKSEESTAGDGSRAFRTTLSQGIEGGVVTLETMVGAAEGAGGQLQPGDDSTVRFIGLERNDASGLAFSAFILRGSGDPSSWAVAVNQRGKPPIYGDTSPGEDFMPLSADDGPGWTGVFDSINEQVVYPAVTKKPPQG